jgi:hypothetical protein
MSFYANFAPSSAAAFHSNNDAACNNFQADTPTTTIEKFHLPFNMYSDASWKPAKSAVSKCTIITTL